MLVRQRLLSRSEDEQGKTPETHPPSPRPRPGRRRLRAISAALHIPSRMRAARLTHDLAPGPSC